MNELDDFRHFLLFSRMKGRWKSMSDIPFSNVQKDWRAGFMIMLYVLCIDYDAVLSKVSGWCGHFSHLIFPLFCSFFVRFPAISLFCSYK